MVRLDAVRAWFARRWPWPRGGAWSRLAARAIFRRRPPVWEFQKKARQHKRKV